MADQIIEYDGDLDETTVDNVFAEMIARAFMEQFEGILTFDEANPTVLSRVDEDGTTRTISIISDAHGSVFHGAEKSGRLSSFRR